MASTSNCDPKVLMAKGKRATATYIHADCSNERNPQHLNEVMDNLLNPQKSIEEWETIDWCKWLMAGGRTPDEFASTVRAYDNATTCGLVWTPNFVAYRCRTCGISPCMSLCTECFKKGNHARHDFNMFLSQAGGACDCGDSSVMKEAGFCERHGPNKRSAKGNAPTELMCVAEAMMPRIILRLIQHLREYSRMGSADAYKGAIQDADAFITMLLDFNNMGGLMRRVITSALTNPQVFKGHQLHKYHIESIHAYENVKKIAEGKSEKVINLIDTDRKKKAKENRKKLTPIIEGIIVCGQQELALRGHRDYGKIDVDNESKTNEGNFRAIVKYRAKGDAEFKNTLDAASKRESYLSPHIQNEIIDCINVILLKQLAAKINKADFFSVLVDETTDIATIEQITLCVRYVVDDSGTHNIREDFLQFVIADGLTGEQLANSILTGLQKCNIDLTNLIGQGYDGANNMSGKFSGVQSVVRRKYPKALYVHCAAHVLNLAISKASSIPQIRNCLSTMERIYDFLKTPKRKNALLKAIDDLEEPVSTKSLKRLCATRWTAKYEAANDFIELYECVVETLRQISTWHDTGDAPMLLTNILDGEFIVAMHIIQQIFNIGLPLSRILQKIDIDLKEAIAATEDAVSTLEKIRSNADDEFKVIFEQSLKYRVLNEVPENPTTEYEQYQADSRRRYDEALQSLPNPEPIEDYKEVPSLQQNLVHKTFLEELVFWTVKFEFPQKIVCLLLNMLPDSDYKEALTRAVVLHYSRISMMLERSADPDTLSNRVVHVSVQLFSNQNLALKMTEQLNLLHVMVVSLKYMMSKILIKNTLHDRKENFHYVVDCAKPVMKDHCYWPLVSDLKNVLSHRPVALKFMSDDGLLEMWFAFLAMFQGMNVNQRELNQHIEFEPNTYYAAFSAELEASAYPMWALISHLTDASTAHLTKRVLNACLNELKDWFQAIAFLNYMVTDSLQVSFHLPLHRYLAVFLSQAVAIQGVTVDEVLGTSDFFLDLLMMHPLRVQVAFYEILNGLWLRNGLQIKGQAMTYIQCNFCNSMVDADLYLLQICCTRLPSEKFLNIVIEKFHVKKWMSLAPFQGNHGAYLEGEHDTPMLESFLTFLATLISVRTNLGLLETSLNRLEMVTLLCMGDKTHSQLMELMPERCGMSESRDFESLLAEVAFYRAPALETSGNMQQGMYVPKPEIWEKQYDPIHVLLRAVHRRDFQTSMDRYTEYARHTNKLKPGCSLWPPFRTPTEVSTAYEDPRQILQSRVFHAAALIILFKAVRGLVSEHVMALVVFLLEQAVLIAARDESKEDSKMCSKAPPVAQLSDMDLSSWYAADSVFDNLKTLVGQIVIHPEPDFSPITYSSDSDIEWDSAEIDADMADIDPLLMLDQASSNMWDNETQQQSESREVMVFRPPADETASPIVETPPATSRGHIFALPSATSVPMEVDRIMNLALPESVASITEIGTPSPTETPALPPPVVRPALMAGSEVGRTVRKPTKTTSVSSTSRELVPTTSQGHRKSRSNTPLRGSTNYPPVIKVNESIISLLLRLHSQLSGVPDSYNPDEVDRSSASVETEESSVGDGVFYIGRLLQRISSLDENCRNYIQDARMKLWPSKEEREEAKKQRESREREERRRRAKERQQKLMQEFANKQKQFMEKAMECDDGVDDDEEEEEEEKVVKQQEYDCVICNQSSPSTDEHPMGLVVLIQATSTIGHMRRHDQPERSVLPTCEEEQELLKKDDTLAAEYDRRIDELDRHFDPESWFLSLNQGWDGGVHVQTCGHHLHLDCLDSYLSSLRTQQRQLTLSPEKGEYLCPLCRQLANSFLPLSSQLGDKTQMVRSRPSGNMSHTLEELSNFLRENDRKPNTMKMLEAIGKAMEDMSNSTQLKARFKLKNEKPIILQSLLLFVTSIARTNLEVELIQRGGSLVQFPNNSTLLPKRDCIVPLLHVLAVHARVARVLAMWPAWMSFQQLCGMSAKVSVTTLAPIEREVPLLLRDPIALLLQYVLLLPMPLDQTYFTTTVQMVYNLLYYQVVAQMSCGLTGFERAKAAAGANKEHINNLTDALGLINECLGQTDLYMDDNDDSESGNDKSVKVNMVGLELQVQKLCLPFLRIAALLKHHLYQQPLPDIYEPNNEFVRLVYYLELVTESMDWGWFNASVALTWTMDLGLETKTPRAWCEQLGIFIGKSQLAAKGFLAEQHILWYPPRLLQLPREYERIFTYYHERPCRQCQSVAQETSICLLCGTIVCLKQNCCKQQNICEAVAHAAECGAGTGIFLVVTSTYIIVIRGHRACLWGSLYLDDFEEEDRDLKRGKPLYLSTARYKLLEQQWLAHRFDHTEKTWVPHRNAL